MPTIPVRVADRLRSSLKEFQAIVQSAKSRDVNESDTVIIVTDMLSAVFGYDKYSEVTSELDIRGTHCDLATKSDGKIQSLIEVKAVGTELKQVIIGPDACPICRANHAQGPIPVDQPFSSGHLHGPFCLGCCCAISAARTPSSD